MPASAATNLVKNGSFETNSGPGIIFNIPGGPTTTVADWSFTRPSPTEGFAAVATYDQAYAGTTNGMNWWGVAPAYRNGNGLSCSPDGGYFFSTTATHSILYAWLKPSQD